MTEEHEMLRRARLLDEVALGTIFDTYYPVLYRYIYLHLPQVQTAEDLTAEVFARMLEQLSRGCGPRHHLRAWLYQVAHNLVVDHCRRSAHRDHEPLDEETMFIEDEAEEHAEAALLRELARHALLELTPAQRSVIILRYLEGYDNEEVAQVLGTTVGAVKALQHRGLAAMQQHLDPKADRQVSRGNGHGP